MVAGVEVAIVLKDQGAPTGFCENAKAGRCTQPGTQGQVENLDEDPPDISLNSFIKDAYQKASVGVALYGENGVLIRFASMLIQFPLEDGNELDKFDRQ